MIFCDMKSNNIYKYYINSRRTKKDKKMYKQFKFIPILRQFINSLLFMEAKLILVDILKFL